MNAEERYLALTDRQRARIEDLWWNLNGADLLAELTDGTLDAAAWRAMWLNFRDRRTAEMTKGAAA